MTKRTVNIVSKEGETFEVDLEVAKMSNLVVNTMDGYDDDDYDDDEEEDRDILIPNVRKVVLEKVIDFCRYYKQKEEMSVIQIPLQSSKLEDVVQDWYVEFCKVDEQMLFELISAANFMDVKPLLDLSCFAIAVLLKGKSESEIHKIFNMDNGTSQNGIITEEIELENEWSDKP